MASECSNCFFARTVPTDSGLPAGTITCNRNAPVIDINPPAASWPWQEVKPDYWCGDYSATDPNVYYQPSVGPTGPPGLTGNPGHDAASWTFSESAPSGGSDGNIWFQTFGGNAFKIFLKSGGSWVAVVAFP
jgi:hypothetical protein